MNKNIQDNYSISNDLLASKGKSFHWARFFLSKVYAVRATRLYGFCRLMDDIADDAPTVAEAKSHLLRIADDLKSKTSDDPRILDAIALFEECEISVVIPLELVAGVMSDLDEVLFENEQHLIQYCYRVAGTVGLMMSAALDVKAPNALFHAIDLGIAMQLTNIARDIKEDAAMNRRYLPADYIGEISPDLLANPPEQVRIKISSSIAKILELADKYYASGNAGLSYLPPGARTAILIASQLYREIGIKIRKKRFDVWSQRMIVPAGTKALLTLFILLSLPWRRSFWAYRGFHDVTLHAHLSGLPLTHSHGQAL